MAKTKIEKTIIVKKDWLWSEIQFTYRDSAHSEKNKLFHLANRSYGKKFSVTVVVTKIMRLQTDLKCENCDTNYS